jgi:hypothetical protein
MGWFIVVIDAKFDREDHILILHNCDMKEAKIT